MKVNAQGGGKDFAVAPMGSHLGICTSVVDLGTQEGEYQGEKTVRRQVVIGFELPDERIPEGHGEYTGKPFFVSKFYTASLHEKATLRKDLENWRGRPFTEDELKGFDLKNVLGKCCLVTVTKSETGKAKISGVAGIPKSMAAAAKEAQPDMELRHFSLDEFDKDEFEKLTKGYRRMVESSPEYKALMGQSEDRSEPQTRNVKEEDDDNMPF